MSAGSSVPSVAGSGSLPAPLDPGAVAAARAALLAAADSGVAGGPYAASWESLSEVGVPGWFTDAKFGIFVHWVASAVPAFGNEWYPRHMYLRQTPEFAHHRDTYGPADVFGYKDLLPSFTGAAFDADALVALVVRAGARYVVPVAEHHDGFSLSGTELSRWSATRVGPRRDVIAEIAAAARRAGVHLGLSSHRAENWWFFHGGRRFDSDVGQPEWADLYGPARPHDTAPDEDFLDDWLARTVELVQRHDPDLVWFDWWIEQPEFAPYLRRFAAYYYNRNPDAVINYKWAAFAEGAAVHDIERGSARTIAPRFFQNDTSTSRRAWCYLSDNELKPVAELIVDLVDAVSKNGSLLLNIGPRPDGTVDPGERALLEGIGDWLAVHGEAIHGTRPWHVFGEGPTVPETGSFVDVAPTAWTSADLRFTARADTLYATFLSRPADAVVRVRSLGLALRIVDAEVLDVTLLGHPGPLRWERTADALVVTLPGGEPAALPGGEPVTLPGCLRIELAPAPAPARHEPSFPQ